MADEKLDGLFMWARGLVQTAASAGFPMQAAPDAGEMKDFVGWAQAVTAGMGGMVPLPSLANDADFAAALAWAKALDGTARGMGADLPPLPSS
jgi:hypothetical protein